MTQLKQNGNPNRESTFNQYRTLLIGQMLIQLDTQIIFLFCFIKVYCA